MCLSYKTSNRLVCYDFDGTDKEAENEERCGKPRSGKDLNSSVS